MTRVKKTLMGVAVLLAAAGAILFVKNHILNSPGNLLLRYMAYLEDGKYGEMYAMLDEDSQKSISKEAFIARNRNIYEGISMKHLNVQVTSKKREETVAYRVEMETSAGNIQFNTKTRFMKEHGTYKMDWDDSVIFPDLTSEDKVKVQTIEAKRGKITDRDGILLAGQGEVDSIGIVPGKMEDDTVRRLAKALDLTEEEMNKKLEQKWVKDTSFVPIQTMDGYPDEVLDIAGVMVSGTIQRVYPLGEAAAHLTGYVQNGEGKAGLEKLYDEKLKGKDGKMISIQDENGRTKKKLAIKPEENGQDLQTTIDRDLQQEIYEQFKKDKGAHCAMDPKSGEILALVSTPSYDNQALSWGMSQEDWKSLSQDEALPMQNRWKAVWCPGSSMKPIIGAIGLTEGKFTAEEDFGNNGTSWQKDKSWGGYYVTTLHGYQNHNLRNAMIYSDNIYFAQAALKIGGDLLQKELEAIGFGEELSFDFGLTKSSYGESDGFESEIQLADSGYGQGKIMMNPVHMLSIYSAFENQGDMLLPRLTKEKNEKEKIWKTKVFSEKAVDQIKDSMEAVIDDAHGTGHQAKTQGLKIFGKTGTAEIKDSKEDVSGTELGWFVTFTKKNGKDDEVEMISMVEDVKGRGGSGYVVGKTKKILEAYMLE